MRNFLNFFINNFFHFLTNIFFLFFLQGDLIYCTEIIKILSLILQMILFNLRIILTLQDSFYSFELLDYGLVRSLNTSLLFFYFILFLFLLKNIKEMGYPDLNLVIVLKAITFCPQVKSVSGVFLLQLCFLLYFSFIFAINMPYPWSPLAKD